MTRVGELFSENEAVVAAAVVASQATLGNDGFRQRDVRNGPAGVTDGYGKIVHFAVLSAARMRAPTFRASTVRVMSSAPLQASSFQ